ncbi:MAG: hypothetical protein CL946_09865 [Ectothiorhodospiraceae bacterium]|nr:hypothetical protein [Ectothiorhodospiraceae bacterium]
MPTCQSLPDSVINAIIADYNNINNETGGNYPLDPNPTATQKVASPPDWGYTSGLTPKINMGINLGDCADEKLPPYKEVNLDADTEDYDLDEYCGWLVTVGTNFQVKYHVRDCHSEFLLCNSSPETDEGSRQGRRNYEPGKPPRNVFFLL